jgi:hypothetical protein
MRKCCFAVAAVSAGLMCGDVAAAVFATEVISYTPGTGPVDFRNAISATGSPDGLTGESFPLFANVLSPFSPAYESDEIVIVGDGGQLTLRLGAPVHVGSGREIGVISNVGVMDVSGWPDPPASTATNPAEFFGGGVGEVLVSQDGSSFVSLGQVNFNMPANYYTDVGAYSNTRGTEAADFGVPFIASPCDFDGKTYEQMKTLLNGSGGGTWIDLSPSGLSEVNYIRFVVADDGVASTYLAIDAVVASHLAVPEPAAMGVMVLVGAMLLRRRRA